MEMSKLNVLIFVSVISICSCGVPFKDCGSSSAATAKVTGVEVSATVTDNVIILKKGSNVTVSVDFGMQKGTVSKVTAVVHGVIAGVPVPFPVPNPDACSNSGLTCPLKSPATDKYHDIISVSKSYPSIRLVVKWELHDEASKTLWCVEMPAKIEG